MHHLLREIPLFDAHHTRKMLRQCEFLPHPCGSRSASTQRCAVALTSAKQMARDETKGPFAQLETRDRTWFERIFTIDLGSDKGREFVDSLFAAAYDHTKVLLVIVKGAGRPGMAPSHLACACMYFFQHKILERQRQRVLSHSGRNSSTTGSLQWTAWV